MISSQQLRQRARAAGFDLVGFARAEPIPAAFLYAWIDGGYHADLDWMRARSDVLLDVSSLLPGARTVVALACNYWWSDTSSPVARYARGRDYHATLRDRLRALRRSVRSDFPTVQDYGSVDSSGMMEKVWAVRAGLGTVTKNGVMTTPEFGSYVVLAAMVLNQEVDVYGQPTTTDVCGRCRICIDACPTGAIVADRTVDARLCLSYQSIENDASIPEPLRPSFAGHVFGCDVCQEVCPLNVTPLRAQERFAPRPLASLSVRELASLSLGAYEALVLGSALARAGYDGLRRNAVLALGAMKDTSAQALLERLRSDESPLVREAADWALAQLERQH